MAVLGFFIHFMFYFGSDLDLYQNNLISQTVKKKGFCNREKNLQIKKFYKTPCSFSADLVDCKPVKEKFSTSYLSLFKLLSDRRKRIVPSMVSGNIRFDCQ